MTDFRFNLNGIVRNGHRLLTLALKHPALLTGVLVTGLVLGVRQTGGLQSLELLAFDQMIRLRPDAEPDPRLLVVGITEDDIRSQNRWPISDRVVSQLLAKLNQYQPKVIGLDIYRDVPQAPGHRELLNQLRSSNNIVTVMLMGDEENGSVLPPPGAPSDRVSFSDFVIDQDAVVRRNLLYASTQTDKFYSFALRLSLQYLADHHLPFRAGADTLQIGNTVFPVLDKYAGGYQVLDDRGYQILLNYRSANRVARQVTLTQVLNGEIKPEWVKDKLVLIGTTAPSAKDLFFTPYNLSATQQSPKTPGVLIHAQMASQILSSVLDGRPLLWYWSEQGEMLWIAIWASIGSILAWRLRNPLILVIVVILATAGLFLVCFGLLLQAGWVPLVPAAIALVTAVAGVVGYRLLYDAFHDALTGLPNRALFLKQLQWAINRHQRLVKGQADTPTIAVLFLGLDGFKAINDSFGHRLGDQLLVATTDRLKKCLLPTDQLARVGGDEFAILRRNVTGTEDVTRLADQLQQQVTLPIKLNGQEVFSTASVGIVVGQADLNYEPEAILRDAHTAMHRAKASGKARHEVFATGMRVQVMTRLQLETDLRRAVEREEFQLHYQPLISLQTGKIAGFEALVRWQHPQRGLVPPNDFIPVAEETDLILPMGQWIIHEACRQIQTWQAQFLGEQSLLVSVNLSGKQFSQPDLVEQIEQTLQKTGLDGRSLKLEITESIAMTDVEATIALLQRLKALHLQLSIDDFGTGYSSLSYLHRFPTNTIKVDRSFVSRMGDEGEDAQIVQTIIILGHNLGMDIVAEGVETAEQLAHLRELKCEYGQGFFFSKPLTAEAAEALLKTNPQW